MIIATRINKFLSKFGSFSRRQADKLINQGRVTINNKNAELGYIVKENDIVKVDGEKIKSKQEAPIYTDFIPPTNTVSSAKNTIKKAFTLLTGLGIVGPGN